MVATQRQADWAARTFYLGFFGTAFILVTLHYTRRAAEAAGLGAKLAERALTELERPYLYVDVEPVLTVREEHGHDFTYVVLGFSNHGRFPADIISCLLHVVNVRPAPEKGHVWEEFQRIVGVGATVGGLEYQLSDEIELHYRDVDQTTGRPSGAYPVRSIKFDTFFRIDLAYTGAGKDVFYTTMIYLWDHGPNRWRLLQKQRT